MNLILLTVCGVAALATLMVLAVGIVASRSRGQVGADRAALLGLAQLRSPTGKPFFPNDDSVLELAELLEDVDERRRRRLER